MTVFYSGLLFWATL